MKDFLERRLVLAPGLRIDRLKRFDRTRETAGFHDAHEGFVQAYACLKERDVGSDTLSSFNASSWVSRVQSIERERDDDALYRYYCSEIARCPIVEHIYLQER